MSPFIWTAPLAIHGPSIAFPANPLTRSTNAMSDSLEHTAGKLPRLPLKEASPVALNGTDGVSTRTELPPLALPLLSQIRVPLTAVTGPGVPMVMLGEPPAKTKPRTVNLTSPFCKFTRAKPAVVVQGRKPPVIVPVPEPTTLPAGIIPTSWRQLTVWADAAPDNSAIRTTEKENERHTCLLTTSSCTSFRNLVFGTCIAGQVPKAQGSVGAIRSCCRNISAA